jgi:hypothetical protein
MVYSFTPSGHIDNIKIRVHTGYPSQILEIDCNGHAIQSPESILFLQFA